MGSSNADWRSVDSGGNAARTQGGGADCKVLAEVWSRMQQRCFLGYAP